MNRPSRRDRMYFGGYAFGTRFDYGNIIAGHQNTHQFWCTMDTVVPSVRTTQSHLAMVRNRLTVNRSARIKIISLSASRPASVSVSQRGRVSDERSMADVTFYSARLKAHCSTRNTRALSMYVSEIFPTT